MFNKKLVKSLQGALELQRSTNELLLSIMRTDMFWVANEVGKLNKKIDEHFKLDKPSGASGQDGSAKVNAPRERDFGL